MKHKGLLLLLCIFSIINIEAQQNTYPLDFNPDNYTEKVIVKNKKEYKIRAYENIVYVANPVDTAYQKMNIYIPEEYFQKKKLKGHTKDTAPIFFTNAIGGYKSAFPLTLECKKKETKKQKSTKENTTEATPPNPDKDRTAAMTEALSRGYIVVSPGARGSALKNEKNVNIGKAPAGIVDLKAAICYLRYNKNIPGDKERIIANGTSAGGAMSALLGASGNNSDYAPYLEALGAANAPDHILAVSAYCPITDLNHSDGAYEWQFYGVNSYMPRMRHQNQQHHRGNNETSYKPDKKIAKELTPDQINTSSQLKALFPIYVNTLELKDDSGNILTLDENGNGNFKEYVLSFLISSATKAIKDGKSVAEVPWIQMTGNAVTGIDFSQYAQSIKRMKTPPAFDAFNLSTPENQLFGTDAIKAQHFTPFSYDNSPDGGTLAQSKIIKMMNPMNYILTRKSNTSKYWHIRYGALDNNTSLAMEVILATYLKNKGYDVNFAIAWDRTHEGDYDLDELFKWIEEIIKK